MRTCDICQKNFGDKNLLRHHRRHVHKIPAYLSHGMQCLPQYGAVRRTN